VKTATAEMKSDTLVQTLIQQFGTDHILTDPELLSLYAQDVYSTTSPVRAVARPDSAETLGDILKVISSVDTPVVPRGGGMSYTSGYLLESEAPITVDTSGLGRILDINETNMTVTVETGCRWVDLYEALKPLGLRTRFWGTLSGIKATVGGGLSQNGVFWGSGQNGTAADNVLALEVVLANGDIIRTGTWSHGTDRDDALAFARHYGPDITGLFLADAGAMGVKTKAVLPLVPIPEAQAYASFEFDDWPALSATLSEIGRQRLVSECFAFDPFLQAQRMKRETLAGDLQKLKGVVTGQGGLLKGLKEGVKVAMAGRGFLDDACYSMHVITEGRIQQAADADIDAVTAIATRNGGRSTEASIPKIMATNPFGPVNSMIGPEGERWVPIHGLVAHDKVHGCMAALKDVEARFANEIKQHDVGIGYLLMPVGAQSLVIEPVFFWPDALNDLHRASVDTAILNRIPNRKQNADAAALVETLRSEMKAVYRHHKALHMQIGRSYGYAETLDDIPSKLITALKHHVDPKGLMNPGALLPK